MASDPLADWQNSIGIQGLVGQNPYLTYQGQIPMAGFRGTPTDAMGRPIQSYLDALNQQTPGTTINSAPQQVDRGFLADQATNQALIDQIYRGAGQSGGGMSGGGSGTSFGSGVMLEQLLNQTMPPQALQNMQQSQPTSTTTPGGGPDLRQAYLDALSNPGKVTTLGAQIYPGAQPTGSPQPSVLQQFLANNRAGTGAGGYTNQPFFQTLNALQAQRPT